jgi:fatty-acyl-CoA synthase
MSEVKMALDAFSLYREKRPDHVALICGEDTRTWKEFDERANQVANALLEHGIKTGQKVGISVIFDRSIEFMETFYGAMKLGIIPYYLNYRFTGEEARYVIENADTSFLFSEDKLLPTIQGVKDKLKNIKEYVVIGEKENVPEGMIHFEELVSEQPKTPPNFDWEKPKPDDDCRWFQYTTGTTGMPKGASLSPKGFISFLSGNFASQYERLALKYDKIAETANVKKMKIHPERMAQILAYDMLNVDRLIELFGDEVFLCLAPLITAAGTDHSMMFLTLGFTVAFPSGTRLDPDEVLRTIEKRKVTRMLVTGDTMALPIIERLKKNGYNTSSLGWTYSTGVKCSKNVKKAFLDLIPTTVILDGLSSTEAWYHSFNLSVPGEEPEEMLFDPRLPQTVVVVNDEGKLVEPGEKGEIISLKECTEWYYKDPEKTKETFKEIQMPFQEEKSLWVFTGDYGTVDEKGRIVFIGRGAEVIDSGGLKVFTPEVRDVIVSHPNVQDAAVIGTPHERWGETVTAIIQLKEGASLTKEEIVDYCREKLADYKLPRRVVFAKVPRDPQGKIPIKEAVKLAKKELRLE